MPNDLVGRVDFDDPSVEMVAKAREQTIKIQGLGLRLSSFRPVRVYGLGFKAVRVLGLGEMSPHIARHDSQRSDTRVT